MDLQPAGPAPPVPDPDPVPTPDPAPAPPTPAEPPEEGFGRATVEFLLLLGIGILILRTFAAEAYVVPTGSMAPTLLGYHKEVTCPNCGFPFVVGLDEQGRSPRPVCPNCGQDRLEAETSIECNGDRLLVQKFFFDVRRPRRWEVAVFQSPTELEQAYVKRVVGLPGESVQVVGGDVWIDGALARKSAREQRATRILVHDSAYRPADSDRFPRWSFRGPSPGRDRSPSESGWRMAEAGFAHDPKPGPDGDRPGALDWLEYRHWDPDRGRFGPIRDFCPYNGADLPGDHIVQDVAFEATLAVRPGVPRVVARIDHGGDRFLIAIPVDSAGAVEVRRNGRVLAVDNPGPGIRSAAGTVRLDVSTIDQRLSVEVDGVPLFEPVDFTTAPGGGSGTFSSPVAIGVPAGASAEVGPVRVYRDIYYTGSLAAGPRHPFGVDEAYRLGSDEYFVLGDNSPVSNDSRFWERSPVVRGDRLLGKPFLVHLPGQVCPLRVFGRSFGWIPDPREIRYIR